MGNVEKNLPVFVEYNRLQAEIDKCNKLVSALKTKRDPDVMYLGGLGNIQDELGQFLVKAIGPKIVVLIEGEKAVLEAQQQKLELDTDF